MSGPSVDRPAAPVSELTSPERADEGLERIDWVRRHMPILRELEQRFRTERPFAGRRVTVCVHLEAKTAYLALVLQAGGAEVAVTGSNPESTKDEVVAALAKRGLHVYAKEGAAPAEMRRLMELSLEFAPDVVIDDGGDLVEILHRRPDLLRHTLGACEETTSGVRRARQRELEGTLDFPVLLINDARCKYLFDNVHGTGQSVWDAVIRSTNLALAGRTVVIVGYGWCGRGCAQRAQGLGARVVVCEVDAVKAADAAMNGFQVMPLLEACDRADIVLTVTGVDQTLRSEHFAALPDGALLANAGHFWTEIDVPALKHSALEQRRFRPRVDGYRLAPRADDQQSEDRWIYLLGDGNIVNIACADGHPAEIMDTSFALQALSARYVVEHGKDMPQRAIDVPSEIDEQVAQAKLRAMRIVIDSAST